MPYINLLQVSVDKSTADEIVKRIKEMLEDAVDRMKVIDSFISKHIIPEKKSYIEKFIFIFLFL